MEIEDRKKEALYLVLSDPNLIKAYAKNEDGTLKRINYKIPKEFDKYSQDELDYFVERYNKELSYNKLKEKNKEILELLNEGDLLDKKYIDLGECSEGMYIGFNLNGREAIITTNGNIYQNKQQKIKGVIIGENEIKKLFDYDGYIGEIAPIISNETIKRYYTKVSRNHLINPKQLYKIIRDKILFYMDFSGKDEIADVLTCWIIATYIYPLFYWFPHILINAPSNSGKSKCAFIIIQMAFRGFDLGASAGVSPPQIFRTIEGNRGTILIDEYETSKGKNNIDTQQLVNQLLNASASKDAYVIRVEQVNGKWIAKKFPIFCPKITSNISGINPTSLSRFIAFSWLKTKSKKTKQKPQKEKDKLSFKPIREDLYLLSLEMGEEIKKIYDNLDIDLTDRIEDNWLPLFAIARFIDSSKGEDVEVEKNLKVYLENYKELQIETGDNTEEFFRILNERVEEEQKYYTPKEIGEWSEIQDLFSYLKCPANVVGKILKSYKFKDNRSGGIKKYLLSKEFVKNIINLYFDKNITPLNTTLHTQQHKQHINTQEGVSLCGCCGVINEGGIIDKIPKKPDGWCSEEQIKQVQDQKTKELGLT